MSTIDEKLLDEIASLEVNALLEGLKDPDLRRNPAFLEKVRKFLAQNKLQVTPETEGVQKIQKLSTQIPTFEIDKDTIGIN